jgi:hypothetical protein
MYETPRLATYPLQRADYLLGLSSPSSAATCTLFPKAKLSGGQHPLRLVFMSGDWIPITLTDLVKSTFQEWKLFP